MMCRTFSNLLPELDPKGAGLQAPHEDGAIIIMGIIHVIVVTNFQGVYGLAALYSVNARIPVLFILPG